ncbi:MAG: hypothetical protein P1V19_22250 [Gimesia sp.]|nr:hypothetical protein [Gimesia sp.]
MNIVFYHQWIEKGAGLFFSRLVKRAEEWDYGSAWARQQKQNTPEWLTKLKKPPLPRLWRSLVNKLHTDAELAAVRKCIIRGTPLAMANGPATP